jgi:hypothetical protein
MSSTVDDAGQSQGRPRGRILTEVAVVFIGITASFWVDDWREKRQDTETFHRILGEIYYDLRIDDSITRGLAADNNRALLAASDLVFRDGPLPEGEELTRQLTRVFASWEPQATLGGYTRLVNTPLAIPVNDVQMSLDNTFGLFFPAQERVRAQIDDIRALADVHWWGRGVIPCTGVMDGIDVEGWMIEDLDLKNQARPVDDALQRDGGCIPAASNDAVAAQAMRDESFRTVLRRVVAIRQGVAGDVIWLRTINARLRATIEGYLPDISLPIKTLGLVGSATPVGWEVANAIDMRRTAPNEWVLDVTLTDGEVKFAANGAWTMNWGAPHPWVGTDVGMTFAPGQVPLEDVFPRGRGQFNGLNIPVTAGHYRVSFNSRTGEYRFE